LTDHHHHHHHHHHRDLSTGDVFGAVGVIAACALVGGVFAMVWLWLIKKFPKFMITLSVCITLSYCNVLRCSPTIDVACIATLN
jgi:CHASE2 domain-containing sensor protein